MGAFNRKFGTILSNRLSHGYSAIAHELLHAFTIVFLRARLFCQVRLGLLKVYQPHPFGKSWGGNSEQLRACADRLDAMAAKLPVGVPLSTLDLGCNIGYFTFRFAERGGLCIGIDVGLKEIMAARALAAIHDVPNAVFAQIELTVESGRQLPRVDLVICLSIFHHLVRAHGERIACEIMEQVARLADRFLVFETGQPDELSAKWAREMSFMYPDPDKWIRNFLSELGFSTVHNLGRFSTSVSNVPRHLYLAERNTP